MDHTQEYADEVDFTDTETRDIDEAIEAAAECDLNYIKVTKHLGNVLDDVEDILTNQRSDLFQLSSWLAKIITTFGLKVCSKNEWNCFSTHYNQETGEVTTFEPTYETIGTADDTPGV